MPTGRSHARSPLRSERRISGRPGAKCSVAWIHKSSGEPCSWGETFRGHLETAAAWDDFLGWAEDYHPALKEIADLGGDRVYAAVALIGTGKNSGKRMDATFFDVITVRDGLIARIEEYTEKDQALEAVGLEE